jgi:DNA-binding transcriptional regulator YhcF (GntR family)
MASKPNSVTTPSKMPITVRGQHFESIAAAAKHFGVCHSTAWRAFHNMREDMLGTGKNRAIKTVVNGVEYKSQRDAATAIGMNVSTFQKKIANGEITTEDLAQPIASQNGGNP